jgi:hypothetical protein
MKGRLSVFVFFLATLFVASTQGSFQVSSERDRPVYTKKQAGGLRFEPQQPNSDLFTPYETYWVGSWPEAVAIGDVSGDGRNDVVMTTSYYFDPENDYKVFVFRQSPDGQLLPPEKYDGGNGESVDIGDFNHDGRNDLVVPSADGIGILLQNSTGRLDPMTLYPIFLEPHKVRRGDFNADGLADVAAVSWGGRRSFRFPPKRRGDTKPGDYLFRRP